MLADRLVLGAAAGAALLGSACSRARPSNVHADTGTGRAAAARDSATQSGDIVLSEAQRARIILQRVAPSTFRPVVTTTGTVAFDGNQSTQVLSPISGPVLRVLVQPGARVRRGQPLALLSSPDFATAVAAYRKAAATARNASRVATLDSALFANDALARRDLELAQTDAVGATADREAARQALVALGIDSATIHALRDDRRVAPPPGVIRAPIAGTVVTRAITPGQLLQAGTTPCFTIAELSRVWVMASVFESDLARVSAGDSAEVTTPAFPQRFPGVVDYVAAAVDSSTRATGVRIVVPNPRHRLEAGMLVSVGIRSRRPRTGLLVPVSAVLRDDNDLPFVYVAAPGARGHFARRAVTLGDRIGERYEVSAGLRAGDQVVAQGALFLQFAASQ